VLEGQSIFMVQSKDTFDLEINGETFKHLLMERQAESLDDNIFN
jgi:hypothetical protein